MIITNKPTRYLPALLFCLDSAAALSCLLFILFFLDMGVGPANHI